MLLDDICNTLTNSWKNLRFDQTPEGKWARKEIHEEKWVGYCDGTAIDRGVNLDGTPKENPYD